MASAIFFFAAEVRGRRPDHHRALPLLAGRRAPAGVGRVLLEVDLLAKHEPVEVVAPTAARHCHPLPCSPPPTLSLLVCGGVAS